MKDLAINETTGDLDVARFDVQLVEGLDALAQRLRIRWRHFLGEWYLDRTFGLPYFESILVKRPDLAFVDALLKRITASCPGVKAIQSFGFEYDPVTRALRITGRVLGDAGVLNIDDTITVG